MTRLKDVQIPDDEVNALASAAWRARTRGRDTSDALISLLRRIAPEHETIERMDALARQAGYRRAGRDERFGDERFEEVTRDISRGTPKLSTLPCRCGEHHRLGEFAPGSRVAYAQQRRPRSRTLTGREIGLGEMGIVVEWSQLGGALSYRVQFGGEEERDNFYPCELGSVS